MSQYGGFSWDDTVPNKLDIDGIPSQEKWKDVLLTFLGECWCVARVNEGVIFHLKDGSSVRVDIMKLTRIVDGDDFISFSFEENKNDLIIPYKSILYFEFLPYNSDTIKLG